VCSRGGAKHSFFAGGDEPLIGSDLADHTCPSTCAGEAPFNVTDDLLGEGVDTEAVDQVLWKKRVLITAGG